MPSPSTRIASVFLGAFGLVIVSGVGSMIVCALMSGWTFAVSGRRHDYFEAIPGRVPATAATILVSIVLLYLFVEGLIAATKAIFR